MLNFIELDKVIFNSFARLNVKLNNNENKKVLKYIIAVQHNVFDYVRTNSFSSAKNYSFLKSYIYIKKWLRFYNLDQLAKILYINKSNYSPYKNVFFAENFVPHILETFIKIYRKSDTKNFIFLSNDIRAIGYVKKEIDIECIYYNIFSISLADFIISLIKALRIIKEYKKERRGIFNEFDYQISKYKSKLNRLFRITLFLSPLFESVFEKKIDLLSPPKIILGSDGFYSSRLLLFLARQKKIKTFVIQHGILDSYNGYLPLISENIFVWSEFEKKYFCNHNIEPSHILVTGSLKIGEKKYFEQVQNISTNRLVNVLVTLSPIANSKVKETLDLIISVVELLSFRYKIIIRPHPYFKGEIVYLLKKYKNYNFIMDKYSLHKSLFKANIILTEISSIIFDSFAYEKPIIVFTTPTEFPLNIYGLDILTEPREISGLMNNIINNKDFSKTYCEKIEKRLIHNQNAISNIINIIEN